jgi:TfoX/Sxy family transcriptional regulator of competence genes
VESWIQPDVKGHYPTDVLVTDRGIIFFWVARMVMMANELTGTDPFHTVYIHGTILDDKGRKMSKSLGNGIDPLEMADQYGADAVRFSLLILSSEGQDIKLSPVKFEMGRNFANKLWNATRFVLPHLEGADANAEALDPADRWIRSRLATVTENVTKSLEACKFAEAAMELYHFAWGDFCSWYLELRKAEIHGEDSPAKRSAVGSCLQVLDALTAFSARSCPPSRKSCASTWVWPRPSNPSWPSFEASVRDEAAEAAFARLIAAVEAVRSLRGRYQIAPSKELSVVMRCDDRQGPARRQPHGPRRPSPGPPCPCRWAVPSRRSPVPRSPRACRCTWPSKASSTRPWSRASVQGAGRSREVRQGHRRQARQRVLREPRQARGGGSRTRKAGLPAGPRQAVGRSHRGPLLIPAKVQEQLLQDALRWASLSAATTSQKMLGGQGISVKGSLFALLLPQGTALKLSADDQKHLLELPGSRRFEIEGDPARSMIWVLVPESLMDQTNHYASWVRKAFQFCEKTVPSSRRMPPKPGRKASHGRTKG